MSEANNIYTNQDIKLQATKCRTAKFLELQIDYKVEIT
jgi:hypothetical protein